MDRRLTVSQLNNYIKGVFDDELILQNITVTGEIFEFKTASNNTYMALKDGDSIINCVYFSSLVNYPLGAKASFFGSVKFYPKSSRVSFIIKSVKLEGEGEIIAKLKETKERLLKEGIFDNNRQLKNVIQKVALVTSGEGAVMHDFFSVLFPLSYMDITVFSVKVQGSGAKDEIITVLKEINDLIYGSFDVIVITRGGGSSADLSEFNSEDLAYAIHKSKIAVISAIGHETDYTLCDFASDYRAPTASLAAELIAKNNSRFFNNFFMKSRDIKLQLSSLIDLRSRQLFNLSDRIDFKVGRILDSANKKCININYEIQNLLQKKLSERELEFKVLCARIDASSPLRLLSKGYSKINKDKKPIKSVDELKINDKINITLTDGELIANIEDKKKWISKKSF